QAHLYTHYKTWCQNEGVTAISSRAFANRVREATSAAG
ncbi:primase-like DNA-binding domain-containing protein, partial [Streptomyces jumonjinensis]